MNLPLAFASVFLSIPSVLAAQSTSQAPSSASLPAPESSYAVPQPSLKTQTNGFVIAAIHLFPSTIFPQSTVAEAPLSTVPDQNMANPIYRIQLASEPSDAKARQEWTHLLEQHPQILQRLSLTVEKANLGAKGTFYRIQAGPFRNAKEAQQRCAELIERKAECIMVKSR